MAKWIYGRGKRSKKDFWQDEQGVWHSVGRGATTPNAVMLKPPQPTTPAATSPTAQTAAPAANKSRQSDTEWYNDVPAAGGGTAARSARKRQQFIYDKNAGAGVKQGFVSPRMRQARAAFAFDTGRALPTGGTQTKTGMGIGPVASSKTQVLARRQAEAEAELAAARNRAGIGPQQAAEADAAKAKAEAEQQQRQEDRAFGRDVAMERLRQGGRAGLQAGEQDFEAAKLEAEQQFKAGQGQAEQDFDAGQTQAEQAIAGVKAGTHEWRPEQVAQLRNLDDATGKILADQTLDASGRQAALGEVARQRASIMPTAKLDTGTVRAADVVKDAVTYDNDGNAFILQPDGKIDFHAKKPDVQDKPVVDFQTFNQTIAEITTDLATDADHVKKVSKGTDKAGKALFDDVKTPPTHDEVMKVFKERMEVWKKYQEELTGKPKTEQPQPPGQQPASASATSTGSDLPPPYAPLREPPAPTQPPTPGQQPPAAPTQPPAAPPTKPAAKPVVVDWNRVPQEQAGPARAQLDTLWKAVEAAEQKRDARGYLDARRAYNDYVAQLFAEK
ncbi:MAG TPA: hypothetical protein VM223_05170 [Planctomycetota bacterium]|nr:hypothetical protein [Planctomycetota bacterium]